MARHGTQHHHPPQEPSGPPIGVHGMLLVGEAPVYFSHLPMFMAPHNFQVILEVTLDAQASRRLGDFRARFGRDGLYTAKPEEFSIADLVAVDPARPALAEFKADIVKGHFEKGGDVIAGGAAVRVDDVIHFRELGFADKAAELEYILFGTEQQFFLAHRITRPPDFDQILSVNVSGHRFTEDELSREHSGVLITIPGRSNTLLDRIKPGEKVSGRGHVVGAHQFLDLQVEVLAELYFEEGELREKATFSPTEEEEAAGFGGE
ncbi:MAG: hypothetical protein M3454_05725 [Actinomycetota bacterium]|nr:hypothetical protein [Actinomycetota bacterium]